MNRDFRVKTNDSASSLKWVLLAAAVGLLVLIVVVIRSHSKDQDSILILLREPKHSTAQTLSTKSDLRRLLGEDLKSGNSAIQLATLDGKPNQVELASLTDDSKQGFIGELRSAIRKQLPQSSFWKDQSNTAIFYVTAIGVMAKEGGGSEVPSLLSGKFVAKEAGRPAVSDDGVVPLQSVIDLAQNSGCENNLIVLDSGHMLVDPLLEIEENQFVAKVSELKVPDNVWILCSNDDYQLNAFDVLSRQSVFGAAFDLAASGYADQMTGNQDGKVTLKELFKYIYRHCVERTRGETSPVLIGSASNTSGSKKVALTTTDGNFGDGIQNADFYLSKVSVKVDDGAPPPSDTEQQGKGVADKEDDSKADQDPPIELTGEWARLQEVWTELDISKDVRADEWFPMDIMPVYSRRWAQDLLFAQNQLIWGDRNPDIPKKSELKNLASWRSELNESIGVRGQLGKNERLLYRMEYLLHDFVLLGARLSTFDEHSTRERVSYFSKIEEYLDRVGRLASALEQDHDPQSADFEAGAQDLEDKTRKVFDALDELVSTAIEENCPGVVHCLLTSLAISSDQRAKIYDVLDDEPSLASPNLPTDFVLLAAKFVPDVRLISGKRDGLPNSQSNSVFRLATQLRKFDGREDLASIGYEWSSEELFPRAEAENASFQFASLSRLELLQPDEPQEIVIQAVNLTQKATLQMEVDRSGLLEIKFDTDQFNPGEVDTIRLKVTAKDYVVQSTPIEIPISFLTDTKTRLGNRLTLQVSPPVRGNVALQAEIANKKVSDTSSNRGRKYLPVRCFPNPISDPNRTTDFSLKLTHNFATKQSFRATVYKVVRPENADWEDFALKDLDVDDWKLLESQPRIEVGEWKVDDGESNRPLTLTRDSGSNSSTEPSGGETPADNKLSIDQSLLVNVQMKQTDGSYNESSERIWIDFDIVHPSEYIEVKGPPLVSDGFDIKLRTDQQFPSGEIIVQKRVWRDGTLEEADTVGLSRSEPSRHFPGRVGDGQSIDFDVDDYPRAFAFAPSGQSRPSRFEIYTVEYQGRNEKEAQPAVNGRKGQAVFDGNGMGTITVVLKTDRLRRFEETSIGLTGRTRTFLYSDRAIDIKSSISDSFGMSVRTEVKDFKIPLTSRECKNTTVKLTCGNKEDSFDITFDSDDPSDIGFESSARIDVKDPANIEIVVKGSDAAPKEATLQIRRHSPSGKENDWMDVGTKKLRENDFRERIRFKDNQELLDVLSRGTLYDLRLVVTDRFRGKKEREYPRHVRIQAAPAPVIVKTPKKEKAAPKKTMAQPLPPNGKVTIKAIYAGQEIDLNDLTKVFVERMDGKNAGPVELDGNSFRVNEAGEYEVSLRGTVNQKTVYKNRHPLVIATQDDVKEHRIKLSTFK